MTAKRPFLLDCTRTVARHLAGHQPSGIDRVCEAYLAHFASRSQAVLQYRGKVRVLTADHSRRLFTLLQRPVGGFRRRFAKFAPTAYRASRNDVEGEGLIYLNVSHTDFDLPAHSRWVRNCGVRAIYLLHDLIPIMHPQWTTRHRTARHRGRVISALQQADGIIVNSRTTEQHLAQFAQQEGLECPPLLSAPLAASDLPKADPLPDLAGRPYFVCVSTIEARKNHMLLLRVWERLIALHGDNAPRLLLIGKWGVGSSPVRRLLARHLQLSRFVSVRTDCTDEEVASALAGARALLAPSQAEGFGLPVAEAMKCGVPVIASNLPAFVEMGAQIPLFLDPLDEAGWVEAVERFTSDSRERMRQLGMLSQYKAPQWRDHFSLVDVWLRQLTENSGIHAACSAKLEMENVVNRLAGVRLTAASEAMATR
ncbi:MAG: glycosyltransferase [Erythrobacter sp.]